MANYKTTICYSITDQEYFVSWVTYPLENSYFHYEDPEYIQFKKFPLLKALASINQMKYAKKYS